MLSHLHPICTNQFQLSLASTMLYPSIPKTINNILYPSNFKVVNIQNPKFPCPQKRETQSSLAPKISTSILIQKKECKEKNKFNSHWNSQSPIFIGTLYTISTKAQSSLALKAQSSLALSIQSQPKPDQARQSITTEAQHVIGLSQESAYDIIILYTFISMHIILYHTFPL